MRKDKSFSLRHKIMVFERKELGSYGIRMDINIKIVILIFILEEGFY